MPLLHSRIDTSGLANAPLAAAQADQARAATAKTKYDLAAAPVKAAADAKQQKFENVVKVWGPVMQEYAKSTSMTAEQRQAAMQGVVDHISKDPKNADIKDAFFALDGVEFMAPEGTYKLGTVGAGEDKTLSVVHDTRLGAVGIEPLSIDGKPAIKTTKKKALYQDPFLKRIDAQEDKQNKRISKEELQAQIKTNKLPRYRYYSITDSAPGSDREAFFLRKAKGVTGEAAVKVMTMDRGAKDLKGIRDAIKSGDIGRLQLKAAALGNVVSFAYDMGKFVKNLASKGKEYANMSDKDFRNTAEKFGDKDTYEARTIEDRFAFAREAFSRALSGAAIPEHEVVRFKKMFSVGLLDSPKLVAFKIDRMIDISNDIMNMIKYGGTGKDEITNLLEISDQARSDTTKLLSEKLDVVDSVSTRYDEAVNMFIRDRGKDPTPEQLSKLWEKARQ